MTIIDPRKEEARVYVDSYTSFASTLRAWLVAYGIGALVLFTSQDSFSELLKNKAVILPMI